MFAAIGLFHAGEARSARVLQHEAVLSLPGQELRAALPASVTSGADGTVCVTDATTHAGFIFEGDVLVFDTTSSSGLSSPQDLVVDSSGGFVCTDSRPEGGRTIRRLDFYGLPFAYVAERPAAFWQPEHLTLLRDGNYLTTDATNGLLVKSDAATGAILWTRHAQDLQMEEIVGLGRPAEAPDGRLFMPVPGNRQVMVLSAEGEFLETFGVPGGARGRLAFPIGVAFCPDGSIAVLDKMRHKVLLYDQENQFVAEFGTFGLGPSDLYYPESIASTADGRLYVVQGFEGRVHLFRFSATGAGNVTASRPWLMGAGRVERSCRSQREGV